MSVYFEIKLDHLLLCRLYEGLILDEAGDEADGPRPTLEDLNAAMMKALAKREPTVRISNNSTPRIEVGEGHLTANHLYGAESVTFMYRVK